MANDENTNGAHEKGNRWQCKHIVGDVPGENLSVYHPVFWASGCLHTNSAIAAYTSRIRRW
jgi:hypothetical protein